MQVLDYSTQVSIKYGDLNHYLQWCQNYCKGKWSVNILEEAGNEPGSYNFHFDNEVDYMTFIVWKK